MNDIDRRKKGKNRSVRLYTDVEDFILEFAKLDRRPRFQDALDYVLEEGIRAMKESKKKLEHQRRVS